MKTAMRPLYRYFTTATPSQHPSSHSIPIKANEEIKKEVKEEEEATPATATTKVKKEVKEEPAATTTKGIKKEVKGKKTPRRKFDYSLNYKELDCRAHPELYCIGKGEQGVLMVQPYKAEILPLWRFKYALFSYLSLFSPLLTFNSLPSYSYLALVVQPCKSYTSFPP